MDSRPLLGRLFSARVRVHATWSVATVLITGILVTQFPGHQALWERILLGLFGSLLFFSSMAVVAIAGYVFSVLARVRVRNIALFVFGGVSVVPEDGTKPGREAMMAGATIVLNFVAAGLFNWAYVREANPGDSMLVPLLQWLAFFWYMLAILHILPVFPLAGGRILTAAIWKSTNSYLRAIRWSGRTGVVLGVAIGILGLVRLFGAGGQTTNGLLLVFVGWALEGAALVSMRRGALLHALQHTTAGNIMSTEFPMVGPSMSVAEMVHARVLVNGQDYFAVADQGKLLGIVTAREIQRLPKNRWDSASAGQVMRLPKYLGTASAMSSAANVLEAMDNLRVDRIPIVEGDKMVGIVAREGILRLARVRARLRV